METRKLRPTKSSALPRFSFKQGPARKSTKQASKEYRDQMKSNTGLYKLFRSDETLRVSEYRSRQTEEAKQRNRELQRIRQRRYRENLKEAGANNAKTHRTRKSAEVQREMWRNQKKQQRDSMTYQKRTAINKKRREQYIEKKRIPGQIAAESTLQDEPQSVLSSNAFRTAKSRHKKKMLACFQNISDPSLKADVIVAALNEQSPNMKQVLKDRLGMVSPSARRHLDLSASVHESLKETISRLKKNRSIKDLRLKRLMAKALLVKESAALHSLGISKKVCKRVRETSGRPGWEDLRKKRKDALSEDVVSSVNDFFDKGNISRDIPDARGAVKRNGTFEGRKIMESSLRTGYDQFKETTEKTISFSSFKRLRPKNILPFTQHRFRECLCEYCVNVDLKLKTINSFCISNNMQNLQIKDRYSASRLTLCPKGDGEYRKECLDRQCENCGTKLLSEHFQSVLPNHTCIPVCWWQWEMAPISPTASRLTKVKKESVFEGLIEALQTNLLPFSSHLFNAKWQYDQYKSISTVVPSDTVVFCMDYAENYSCTSQDAPQGFHWSNIQCTIHPVVASYRCKMCEVTTTDSIIFVSDDLKHDHHGVQHFASLAIKLLQEEDPGIRRCIQFSDGAPTQYKNKVNFVNCSFSQEDFGIVTEKHFFGSRHGKGPCDREIGVLKKTAKTAVAAGQESILSPQEFFQFCKNKLQLPRNSDNSHVHTKRRFIFVNKVDVKRTNERTNVKAMKDTRKMHCIRGVQPHVVARKERSCFCNTCLGDSGEPCPNRQITGNWTRVEMPEIHPRNQRAIMPIVPYQDPADAAVTQEYQGPADVHVLSSPACELQRAVMPNVPNQDPADAAVTQEYQGPADVTDAACLYGLPVEEGPADILSIEEGPSCELQRAIMPNVPNQDPADAAVTQEYQGPADVPAIEEGPADIPSIEEGLADIPSIQEGPADIPSNQEGPADIPNYDLKGPADSPHGDYLYGLSINEGEEQLSLLCDDLLNQSGQLTDDTFDFSVSSLLDQLEENKEEDTNYSRPSYKPGEFVEVSLPCGKKQSFFVAEIKEVLEDTSEVRLQYMEASGRLYKWPTHQDQSTEHWSSILRKLPTPELDEKKSNSRTQYFKF